MSNDLPDEVIISRKEAAEILGGSEKKIQRLIANKKLPVIYRKRLSGGQESMHRRADVERIKAVLDRGEALPDIPEAELIIYDNRTSTGLVKAQTQALTTQQTAEPAKKRKTVDPVRAAHKLILTVAEASALTSLSDADLRAEIRAGNLVAFERGRGYKITRKDLNAFVKGLSKQARKARAVIVEPAEA